MFVSNLANALLLAGLVSAQTVQTPPGFSPAVSAKLDILFGSKAVATPGQALTKADTSKQPTIGTTDAALTGTYIWMMIDQDVPANFQNPKAGGRRTNLHAMISGFKSSGQTQDGVHTLTSSAGGPVAYVGPSPPAETPPYAHRYVSLLYETKDGFSVTKADVGQTLGFDLAAFVQKTGLGTPIRANYFNVTG